MTEWISVKDRLPKNNQDVLAYYNFDPSDGSSEHIREYKVVYFRFGKNVYEYPKDKPGYTIYHWDLKEPNWGLDERYTVTHWAELPEGPKDD